MPILSSTEKSFPATYYLDRGEGPVLLLGHSFLWDSSMWEPILDELSKSYRCLVPDLWGHGKSAALPESVKNLDDLADLYVDFLNELGIEKCSIIGLSVGGMWGPRLAKKHPDRVEKLVLMNTDVGEEPALSKDVYFGMLSLIEQLGEIPRELIAKIAPGFFAPSTVREQAEILEAFSDSLASWPSENIDSVVRLGRMIFGREDFLPQLSNLKQNVLIIAGGEDVYRSVAEAETMHRALATSQLSVLADAGHISVIDQPGAVLLGIENFCCP